MSGPIDICHACHVSFYVNEMREEYFPDTSGMSPTGYVLELTCRTCDEGRKERVQLAPAGGTAITSPTGSFKLRLVKR